MTVVSKPGCACLARAMTHVSTPRRPTPYIKYCVSAVTPKYMILEMKYMILDMILDLMYVI